jgi:hypothetical protein
MSDSDSVTFVSGLVRVFGARFVAITTSWFQLRWQEHRRAIVGPPEIAAATMQPYGGAIDAWEVGAELDLLRQRSILV